MPRAPALSRPSYPYLRLAEILCAPRSHAPAAIIRAVNRRLRILVLLVLATLLPLRGALAAAMMCPPAAAGAQVEAGLHEAHLRHHAATEAVVAHGHHAGDIGDAQSGALDEWSAAAQDKCDVCSTFCSVTPMLGALPQLTLARDLAQAHSPALDAAAPSFFSDAQERPPRSI